MKADAPIPPNTMNAAAPQMDATAAATQPVSLLGLPESIFDMIDIIECLGIFAISEILAVCVAR
jgi:hypothetical protein